MIRPLYSHARSLDSIGALLGVPAETAETAETGGAEVEILGMTNVSSEIHEGDLFLAFPGAKNHGARFVQEAKLLGARAVLTDTEGAPLVTDLPTLVVDDPRKAAGDISSWFYGEPMRDMYSAGITGTNGKTTTTTLLHQIWTLAGREGGLVGTVETRIGRDVIASKRTTPESAELQSLVATMRERHVRNLAMEVSSHAIALKRMRGAHFNSIGFSNLTQDHLDFHGSMEEYFLTKSSLFTFEFADRAFINIDDAYGAKLAASTSLPVIRLSRSDPKADWTYVSVHPHLNGQDVCLRGPGGVLLEGTLALHGEFNLDNALMAIAIAFDSGIDLVDLGALLPRLSGAQGRLERIDVGQPFSAFVDYAHSPDSVTRVLATCKALTKGKVIAVLGCGGDRDSSKRPLMGAAIFQGADVAIFTSDNPRSEDPLHILNQMTAGLDIKSPNCIISDRTEAINHAASIAQPGDVVVVLGKGHESGQDIKGEITPFDDRIVLAGAIEART
ncbi:MAG: UDP-N-acetylmuramoyl-L-alanyl-D-glutamate--2,6-diaminopimelate ligase [Actinomycetes bacterium]